MYTTCSSRSRRPKSPHKLHTIFDNSTPKKMKLPADQRQALNQPAASSPQPNTFNSKTDTTNKSKR